MMERVSLPNIEIDHSILLSLKSSAEELAYKMKLYTAMTLYQKKQLSLGKAGEFVGMSRLEFIDVLKKEGIPIFDYSDREMNELFDDTDSLSKMLK